MSRPSLKDQRSSQILTAYVACVARFGLDGATQARIAQKAGVKRALLHHYLGDRQQMLDALVDHVAEKYSSYIAMFDHLAEQAISSQMLIDWLFAGEDYGEDELLLTYQTMVLASQDTFSQPLKLLQSQQAFLDVLDRQLQRLNPQATDLQTRIVAQGIAAAYASVMAMANLSPPDRWREDLKAAAYLLNQSLGPNPTNREREDHA